MRAAAAALPFEHVKLAVVASVRQEDLAERLANALERNGKVINSRATQVIEAKPIERSPESLPDHSFTLPQSHEVALAREAFDKESPSSGEPTLGLRVATATFAQGSVTLERGSHRINKI